MAVCAVCSWSLNVSGSNMVYRFPNFKIASNEMVPSQQKALESLEDFPKSVPRSISWEIFRWSVDPLIIFPIGTVRLTEIRQQWTILAASIEVHRHLGPGATDAFQLGFLSESQTAVPRSWLILVDPGWSWLIYEFTGNGEMGVLHTRYSFDVCPLNRFWNMGRVDDPWSLWSMLWFLCLISINHVVKWPWWWVMKRLGFVDGD